MILFGTIFSRSVYHWGVKVNSFSPLSGHKNYAIYSCKWKNLKQFPTIDKPSISSRTLREFWKEWKGGCSIRHRDSIESQPFLRKFSQCKMLAENLSIYLEIVVPFHLYFLAEMKLCNYIKQKGNPTFFSRISSMKCAYYSRS